jgi:acetylornithine deacetylase/succinyl-diaminopimelate desuccinylase-like protein
LVRDRDQQEVDSGRGYAPCGAQARRNGHRLRDPGGAGGGPGDIEFLANDHKVPALYFGPGDARAAYTVDEYLDLDNYHLAVRVYERAIPGRRSVPLRT